MKSGWKTTKLGDVCAMINRGVAPKYIEDGGIPVLNQKCVRNHAINLGLARRHDVNTKNINSVRYIQLGDVLVNSTGTGTLGRVAQIRQEPEEPTTVDTHVTIVRPQPGKFFNDFFGYMMIKIEEEIASSGEGASGQTELARNVLAEKFLVAYPDKLSEQQRIVAILDQAFDGIATAKANAEKNLKNAREIFESHLNAVFTQRGEGWVEKKLSEVGVTQTGSTPKTSIKDNFGNFIPFIKPADFSIDGSLNYQNDGLSKKGLSTARKISSGSVLMVCIGATIGKCGYCERDITTNQQINSLTPKDEVSHRLLYYQMLTEDFQRKVIHGSGQATLPIINKSKWSSLIVWLPPSKQEEIQIQQKMDLLLEETQRLESIYQQKLAALDELKKSLLHQAFTGELTTLPDKQLDVALT